MPFTRAAVASCLLVTGPAACGRAEPRTPPSGLADPSDPPPIPRVSEVPAGKLSCRAAAEKIPAPPEPPAARLTVRAAFAGCYFPPCPPCPPEVTCSPCEQGWCELAGEVADESGCKIQIQGLSPECAGMQPGVVYLAELVPSGGALELATCSEVEGAPRVATKPPGPTPVVPVP